MKAGDAKPTDLSCLKPKRPPKRLGDTRRQARLLTIWWLGCRSRWGDEPQSLSAFLFTPPEAGEKSRAQARDFLFIVPNERFGTLLFDGENYLKLNSLEGVILKALASFVIVFKDGEEGFLPSSL